MTVFRRVLSEVAGPALRARGFRRFGSVFRRWTELDDVAVVHVDRWGQDERSTEFWVSAAVCPRPYRELVYQELPDPGALRGITESSGMWKLNVDAPPQAQGLPLFGAPTTRWRMALDDWDRAAAVLTETLDRLVDTIEPILDRDQLVNDLRAGRVPQGVRATRESALATLLSATASDAEFEPLYRQLREEGFPDEYLAWLRARRP